MTTLISKGHRRIGFIGAAVPPLAAGTLRSLQAGLVEHGIQPNSDWCCTRHLLPRSAKAEKESMP